VIVAQAEPTHAVHRPSLEESLNFISGIDFSMTIKKLSMPSPTLARTWTSLSARLAIAQYRRFLWLLRKQCDEPDSHLVPSPEIDEMWHHHILDTRSYQRDCQGIFGSFQHHFPYFGTRGPEDEMALQREFVKTRELYAAEFGEDIWVIPESLDDDAITIQDDVEIAFPHEFRLRVKAARA